MGKTIGIRREDLNKKGEKRVAIIPELAKELGDAGHTILIQSASHPETAEVKRAFEDGEYVKAGAKLTEDLSSSDIIFGLKEVKSEHLIPEKAYLFFSHTHKGQVKNRSLLAAMMAKKVTLFDYELVNQINGPRIITAFTYFAGYAGMIDTLWTYGQRMAKRGLSHPFTKIPQSIEKEDLPLIKGMISEIGADIAKNGTPESLPPMINLILGDGKTAIGSQEIYDLLPVELIKPSQMAEVYKTGDRKKVYKVVMEIQDMFRLKAEASTQHPDYASWEINAQKQLYFDSPDLFESNLEDYLPYASILMNCILWGPAYPRTISREFMKQSWKKAKMPVAIGDITCDPEGSIEFSKETWIDAPVFIYNPETNTSVDGMDGEGVALMGVTNLPCEFSRDASSQFSTDIKPELDNLIQGNFKVALADSGLSEVWQKACILWQGELTTPYKYMAEYLP